MILIFTIVMYPGSSNPENRELDQTKAKGNRCTFVNSKAISTVAKIVDLFISIVKIVVILLLRI